MSELSYLHNSDKGAPEGSKTKLSWDYHIYTDIYNLIFNYSRFNVKNVFEVGLGTNNPNLTSSMGVLGTPGASLRMWKDYFPNANIFGADIDKDILFQEDRIKTFYVDQTSKDSIFELWKDIDCEFDIMIDDGFHDPDANITFYESSKHKLIKGGIYIIEDVYHENIDKVEKHLSSTNTAFFSFKFDKSNNGLVTQNFIVILNN